MAERISKLLERPPEEGARLVALELLEATALAAKDLKKGKGYGALHDFRTALRRTRSWLQSWTPVMGKDAAKFQRKLKEIADNTGMARDAEVQLEHLEAEQKFLKGIEKAAADSLKKQLRAQYREGHSKALAALPHFWKVQRALRSALRRFVVAVEPSAREPRTFARAAADVLRTLAEDLSLWISLIEGPDDLTGLHKSRIRSKRLRYALEPLREQVPDAEAMVERVKVLQDALGEIHDLHVWRERLVETTAKKRSQAEGLGRLLARAEEQLAEKYGAFQRDWLEGGAAALLAEVNAFADRLSGGAEGGPPSEIERKYLLKSLPEEVRRGEVMEIWQGWIPGEKLQERLRRVNKGGRETFFRTVKLGTGIKRVEVEEETPKELFEKLWPLTEGRRVLKRRYVVKDGDRIWEIDEFLDRDLALAEVELESEREKVKVPEWLKPHLDREVTGEAEYVNVNLAR